MAQGAPRGRHEAATGPRTVPSAHFEQFNLDEFRDGD